MTSKRMVRAIGALGVLGALATSYLYISALSPIVGDLWAVVGRFDSFGDAFRAYVDSYHNGNPRLGELGFFVAGISSQTRTLVTFASLIALTVTAFTVVTGRLFRPYSANDVITVALLLSLLWLIHPEIGQQFFYVPLTANYVLGYALLLAFLIPYRLALNHSWFPSEQWLVFALPFLGLVAGLSNEHTPPVYIVMLCLAVGVLPLSALRRRWMVAGLLGITIGYLLLFFAPGQSKRYGGI